MLFSAEYPLLSGHPAFLMRRISALIFFPLLSLNSAVAEGSNGHFSSWEEVPAIIDSIADTEYSKQPESLHALTQIQLGSPRSSMEDLDNEEHKLQIRAVKRRWQDWWETTGKPVSVAKQKGAKVDLPAFQMASKFLGVKGSGPDPVSPVWIPPTWTLYVTFSNGDYGGREKELWIIDRRSETASLTKLRGSFTDFNIGWDVSLSQIDGFSPEKADETLKAICYLNRYAPVAEADLPGDELEGLYYPSSTLHLRDGENRILWNTKGYDFTKAKPEFGGGESGRTYHFLSTTFPKGSGWAEISKPTGDQLAAHRRFLAFSKPYFSTLASDVIQLFGERGGDLEKESMLHWVGKQKAASTPDMDWQARTGDFSTGMTVNVVNFTRRELEASLEELRKLERRAAKPHAEADEPDVPSAAVLELEEYVAEMKETVKREKEAAIMAFPMPLRDLIRIDRRTDDHDLLHLKAAINAIRKDPKPELFFQLAREMHEGTTEIRALLNYILLDDANGLDLEPWAAEREAIAVNACIDALPVVEARAIGNMIESLLRVFGGGKIEIKTPTGARSIEVNRKDNGYQTISGGASDPLPMKAAREKLRQMYFDSRKPGTDQ